MQTGVAVQTVQKHIPPLPLPAPPETAATQGGNIEARDFHFFYGQVQALADINLSAPARKALALIGPSGCGKSTFLRCLNRMNDLIPDTRMQGTLTLGGEDLTDPDLDVTALRRRVGMVFQKPTPFPKSIFENVAYGLKINGLAGQGNLAERVEKSLIDAALWDEVKDRLHASGLSLSGGQQQRLCIARALAVQPEVLLMDEPASALDPLATQKIEDLIHILKKRVTIVIVTHSMQQAARVSDSTAFFYMGRLIETGPTADIFTRPRQKQTEDYITGRFG